MKLGVLAIIGFLTFPLAREPGARGKAYTDSQNATAGHPCLLRPHDPKRTIANRNCVAGRVGAFEMNPRHTDGSWSYRARCLNYDVYLAPGRLALRFASTDRGRNSGVVAPIEHSCATPVGFACIGFAGCNTHAVGIPINEFPGTISYFSGPTPDKWLTGAHTYEKVRYKEIYPGTDVEFRISDGNLEYDLNVSSKGNPDAIKLSVEGQANLHRSSNGDLEIPNGSGLLLLHRSRAYQQAGGIYRDIAADYTVNDDGQIGLSLGSYDQKATLTIDPVITYSTFLGGNGLDTIAGIASDAAENVYVTGHTSSVTFPGVEGALSREAFFITKFSAGSSTVAYTAILAGSAVPGPTGGEGGIAIDAAGCAYVTGATTSSDFPVTPGAFQTKPGELKNGAPNPHDAFVAKLNPDGTALVYSTYLGGSFIDEAKAIAVDAAGSAYITGVTSSRDFPTTPNAYQTKKGDLACVFVTRLDPTGSSLAFSTLLGGNLGGEGRGIAIDVEGNPYVTGKAFDDFPTTRGAFQEFASDPYSGFVAKFDASGGRLVYSTFLGGHTFGTDECNAIAIDAAGCAYVTGFTNSPDFPSTDGAFQPRKTPGLYDFIADAFVLKLNESGTGVVYSTYLGGSGFDEGKAIAVDSRGFAYVTGTTSSIDFPTVQPIQRRNAGSALIKSTDGGTRWTATGILDTGSQFLENGIVPGCAIGVRKPNVIYGAAGLDFFKSTDEGDTWVSKRLGFSSYIAFLRVDPRRTKTVYAGTLAHLYKSANSGLTWAKLPLKDPSISELVIDPVTTSTLYAVGIAGVYKSLDGGRSWSLTSLKDDAASLVSGTYSTNPEGLPRFVLGFAMDPRSSTTLYASTANGIYISTDAGDTWGPSQVTDPSGTFIKAFIFDPVDATTLYAIAFDANIYKSADGGIHWLKINPTPDPVGSLVVDSQSHSNLYAAASFGIFKSTDAGSSWTQVPIGGVTGTILSSPTSSETIFLATGLQGDIFVAKIGADGKAVLFSTYFGGLADDEATCIVHVPAGAVYVGGTTRSHNIFITPTSLQSVAGGGRSDGFVVRISLE